MKRFLPALTLFLSLILLRLTSGEVRAATRQTIDLDGEWQIAEGKMDAPPDGFDRTVAVPGLVDMAQPAFEEVGVKSARREAFWYRKTFRVVGEVPAVATLRVAHAFFGTKVFLNGVEIGAHLPLFTAGYFDVQKSLKGRGADNQLLIRVGANPEAVPITLPRGTDGEKSKFIPGIFDSVELILCGTPNIVRVQAAPDIIDNKVHVQALLHSAGGSASTAVTFVVKETVSGAVVGNATVSAVVVSSTEDRAVDIDIPIAHAHRWSPEDPFLYTLEVRTAADELDTRFGLREFHFDPVSGHAVLNGQPYFMRGSNITLYRFFEDAGRGALPWDRDWVRRLHHSFKDFHWNSLRYSLGFPPDFWYDIADEEGILLQDEFPIWGTDPAVTTDELAREYAEHMQDHWNHPSVVLWDAQNETINNPHTGAALQQVRHLDLSNRPWDNGWGGVQAETDPYEAHPYHFINNQKTMPSLATALKIPDFAFPIDPSLILSRYRAAIINNEYAGIWLQRNGLPTGVSRAFYNHILGPNATPEQYRETYAHYMAADTEFWRGNRGCAGVMEFTALTCDRPDAVTSDHFVDVKNLIYEPYMAVAFKSAFAPVGLMIDYWECEVPAGTAYSVPVVIINDLAPSWQGSVTLRLTMRGEGRAIFQIEQKVSVDSFGTRRVLFDVPAPAVAGQYDLKASIIGADGQVVTSDRAFPVIAGSGR